MQAIPYIAAAAANSVAPGSGPLVFAAFSVVVGAGQRSAAAAKARRRAENELRSRNVIIRSGIAPCTVVLGTVRTSGPLMYADFVGSNQEYLDSIVAVNFGELAAIDGVFVGDEYIAAGALVNTVPSTGKYGANALTPGPQEESFTLAGTSACTLSMAPVAGTVWAVQTAGSGETLVQTPLVVSTVVGNVVTLSAPVTGNVIIGYQSLGLARPPLRVQWMLGSTTQASSTWSLVSTPRWTANHRLRGVAYVRTLKLIDDPLFLAGDDGNVGVVARGPVGVWDPRTSTTVNGTSNPALLAAWFRTRPVVDGGLGTPTTWIDWPSVAAAANVCDELISVRKLDDSGYENVKRYECNVQLNLEQQPLDNLQIILDSMAGDMAFTAGKYRCVAGAFRAATVTLTDDDVDAGAAITFAPQAGASVAPPNIVTANFYPAVRQWVRQGARAVSNAAYIAADGAEEMLELDLQATVDERQANYLMGVRLEHARPSLAAALTVTGKGANLALLDTVQFNLQGYSAISGKTFEVRRRTNQWNGRYPIELREIKASSYALDADRFTAAAVVAAPVNSMLFDVAALTGVTATEQLVRQADGSIISRAKVAWTAHSQGYVRERGSIRLRWRRPGADWLYAGSVPGSSTEAFTGPLEDGSVAIVEVQALNPAGAVSLWTTAAPLPVLGKAAPPANPASVAAAQVPGGVLITWALNTEADYLDTEIRAGASWASGALQWRGTADRYLLPWPAAGALTLWVAHRDTSKNYSATAVSVGLTVGAASLIGTPQIGLGAATDVIRMSVDTDTHNYPASVGVQDRTFSYVEYANASGATVGLEMACTSVRVVTTPSGLSGTTDVKSWIVITNETDGGILVSSTQDYMPAQVLALAASQTRQYLESTVFNVDVPAGKTFRFQSFTRVAPLVGSTGNIQLLTHALTLRGAAIKR